MQSVTTQSIRLRPMRSRIAGTLALSMVLLCGGCGDAQQPTISSGEPPSGAVGVPYNTGNGITCAPEGSACVPCFVGGSIRQCPPGWRYQDSFMFTARDGVSPYKWSAKSLPSGISVSSDGSVGGDPTTQGSYGAAITVTDSSIPSQHATETVSFVIDPAPPPVIATAPEPAIAALNLPYSYTFTLASGVAPFTWSEGGALPSGLTFASDGTVSGTPTVTGTFPLTLLVQDGSGQLSTPQTVSIEVAPRGFRSTGSMRDVRTLHSATRLDTGAVLIVGGSDGTKGLDTAELYDRAAGTFTATPSAAGGRYLHSATLLNNGRVLIVGGLFDTADEPVATAEVFNPVTGRFTSTGNLRVARYGHTATLLDNGDVLIAGGFGSGRAALATAEIYAVATGQFRSVGDMTVARGAHSATLLANGDVLIAGGIAAGQGSALATAELYDVARDRFRQTDSLLEARAHHAAVRLANGNVLIAGGIVANAAATAEIYDAATGTFTATAAMRTAHSAPTLTRLDDGLVLLIGGGDAASNLLRAAELYDPDGATFASTGSMATARDGHTATLLGNGEVLVTGGSNGSILSRAELYR